MDWPESALACPPPRLRRNNSCFLDLPKRARYPNLASRLLGLTLRRLSDDWQARWGHPVLVVESFVDASRSRGTCYRACGFGAVGLAVGFGRANRDFYHEHGVPKLLYLRELRPRARAVLRCGRLPPDLAKHEEKIASPCPFRAGTLESLLERFCRLHEARLGYRLRHRQPFVLACAAEALLMGRSGYQAFEDTCKTFTQRQLKALACLRYLVLGVYELATRVLKRTRPAPSPALGK